MPDEQIQQPKPDAGKPSQATVIKKYANRRLYNTATSTYVTLDDLAQMVRSGTDFIVYDAKTGEDITRSVLTQIIFDEENKGSQNLLPINFLRQLIRFYGDAMQGVVPGYLELSLDTLTKDQDKIRKQMADVFTTGMGQMPAGPFAGDALKVMEEITRRNMGLFQDAMKAFNPFAAAMTGMAQPPQNTAHERPNTPSPAKDDLQQLRDQMAAMQAKLNSMSKD